MVTSKGHQLAFYVTPGRLPAIVLDAGGGEHDQQRSGAEEGDAQVGDGVLLDVAAHAERGDHHHGARGHGRGREEPLHGLPRHAAHRQEHEHRRHGQLRIEP